MAEFSSFGNATEAVGEQGGWLLMTVITVDGGETR